MSKECEQAVYKRSQRNSILITQQGIIFIYHLGKIKGTWCSRGDDAEKWVSQATPEQAEIDMNLQEGNTFVFIPSD